MAEYHYLVGAEDVRSAASSIHSSADSMRSAASTIYEAASIQGRALEEHAARVERAMEDERPTLRDQFAMAALTGLVVGASPTTDVYVAERVAMAFRYADAAMKAREES